MPDQAAAARPADIDAAMERYSCGDEHAFALVYDALAPRLMRYALRHVPDRARAEELVQQAFLHMHRARGSYLPGSPVLPWAFAITRRLTIDHQRRRAHEVDWTRAAASAEAATARGPDSAVHARELARDLQERLEQLPPSQREAFELVRLEHLPVADAAAVLGISTNAVKLRVHRASAALRTCIINADLEPTS